MLWIRRDLEAEQIPLESADLTAAKIHLPDREVLVVSVYVEGGDPQALKDTTRQLGDLIRKHRQRGGNRSDVVLVGDFNRHDQLWGGDGVRQYRQGEADPIIDLMGEHSLCSLLQRGTKTFEGPHGDTTIDLVLTSAELAEEKIKCRIHPTEHGSDHRAIETIFDVAAPVREAAPRLLFKNAPWEDIKARVRATLERAPRQGNVQQQANHLMEAVIEAVHALTPKAKPSPYAKRWWTASLTQLRHNYTHWRNLARRQRRAGRRQDDLERRAREASKEYHDAIRKQKKSHWDEFLQDNDNIWQAARYLKEGNSTSGDKVPQLQKTDGSTTTNGDEQAEVFLESFFPPLPEQVEDEGERPQRAPVPMPEITMEEVEEKVFTAKLWKAPGEDGLPAVVWARLWPVVRERVLLLFQTSLHEGILPCQWLAAKIIPLKKADKNDYSIAKAWRPISLLSSLGKIMEAVVAERIAYMVEKYGLLPTNHFGARRGRSAEQALILLQEHIFKAWRARKVLSLVTFDIKGAYNGVCKERLLQRLRARGIPNKIILWVDAFCSNRTASILVNGTESDQQSLPQAGLPQGSPLSPVLFLFFNADLVQQKITANGGAMAFADDYSAWVTGPTQEANKEGLQTIIDEAAGWAARSGATFESDKTKVIHFTRNSNRTDSSQVEIDGKPIMPEEWVKILGVIMDKELRYQRHMARAATKGLKAAMALQRLGMTSPRTARQLFTSMVAPVMDYASNVWAHRCQAGPTKEMSRVQKVGASAIVGTWKTVAGAVAEAEASILPIGMRLDKRATNLWTAFRTLPKSNPLSRLGLRDTARFTSPLQKIRQKQEMEMDRLENIVPFAAAPWGNRLQTYMEEDEGNVTSNVISGDILVMTSASARNGVVGVGGILHDTMPSNWNTGVQSFSATLGPRTELSPYYAELEAIARALKLVPTTTWSRTVTVWSTNRAVLLALNRTRQQSGQSIVMRIRQEVQRLQLNGNVIKFRWSAARTDDGMIKHVKAEARAATRQGTTPVAPFDQALPTMRNEIISRQQERWALPQGVGAFAKRIDTALPGKHTRMLYDNLKREEARVLAQMRTGMARLNGYLNRIGATETEACQCGQTKETVEHFMFECTQWDEQRQILRDVGDAKMGNLSFFLGGKEASDGEKWKPEMKAVRAAIKFSLATGRLDYVPDERRST